MQKDTNQKGIILLITLLLMGVLLALTASIINITVKQFQLAGIAKSSEKAFQAANAGAECIQFYDKAENEAGTFDIGAPTTVDNNCMGNVFSAGGASSAQNQNFQFDWGATGNPLCTDVSIYKFSDPVNPVNLIDVNGVDHRPSNPCPPGVVCTVLQSRGYNAACADIVGNPRVVEREITYVY